MWYYYRQLFEYSKLRSERISEISKDIAQVFFAVLAIESFTKEIINWNLVIWGLLLSIIWWIISIISFKIKNDGS
jgi:hypothetical protein